MTDQTARAARFDRTRVESVRMTEGERIRVAADFTATIGDESVSSASWTVGSPGIARVSDLSIAEHLRVSEAMLEALRSGMCWMRCEIVTSGGRNLRQGFVVQIERSVRSGTTVMVNA